MNHSNLIFVLPPNARRSRTASAFSLLEVLLAISVFSIAAISLTGALNTIGVTVVEAQDDAAIREQLRSLLVEKSRSADLEELDEETVPDSQNIFFRIKVERLDLENIEAEELEDLYRIKVTAIRENPGAREEILDFAETFTYPGLFQ